MPSTCTSGHGHGDKDDFVLWEQEVTIERLPLRLIGPANLDSVTFWDRRHGRRDRDPYWARPWPSGLALAALIAREPGLVRWKRVIELGAGVGAPGIVARLVGAGSVLLTDREALALQCAKMSAERSSASKIDVELLDFTQPLSPSLLNCFDVVLATDVLHERQLCEPLALAVASLLTSNGSLILAERTNRYPANLKRFQDLLGSTMCLSSVQSEKIRLPPFTNEMLDFELSQDEPFVETTFLQFTFL